YLENTKLVLPLSVTETFEQGESDMKVNLGNIDRALRIIVGLALIGLSVAGVIGWWGWLGVILLATAFISFCPLYAMLRMNTGKRRGNHDIENHASRRQAWSGLCHQ